MLLYLVRHADPIYEPDSITPFGTRQAEAIGRRLAKTGIDKVYSSSSVRAQLTAKPLCEITKKEPVILDWCNEAYAWDYMSIPNSEGLVTWPFHIPEMKRKFMSREIRSLDKFWYTHPDFKDTRFEAGVKFMQRNADEFFKSLGYEHDTENNIYIPLNSNNDKVALFAHQGFTLLFLSSVLDIPYPQFCSHFDMITTGMTVIEFKDNNGVVIPKIWQHGGDGHLYADNLPTLI